MSEIAIINKILLKEIYLQKLVAFFVDENYVLIQRNYKISYQTHIITDSGGGGNFKVISSILLFSKLFWNIKTTHYLLNIIFIFDRSHCSFAAVPPIKYECDSKVITGNFLKSKISVTEKLTSGSLSTPTSVWYYFFVYPDITLSQCRTSYTWLVRMIIVDACNIQIL